MFFKRKFNLCFEEFQHRHSGVFFILHIFSVFLVEKAGVERTRRSDGEGRRRLRAVLRVRKAGCVHLSVPGVGTGNGDDGM